MVFPLLKINRLLCLICLIVFYTYGYAQVRCPEDQKVCNGTPAFALTTAAPTGGIYSGTGVSNGMFDATIAGSGVHAILYTYAGTDGNETCTFNITVTPAIEIPCALEQLKFCIDTPPMSITGCSPPANTTVTYSGPGITNNILYPAVAGVGTHQYTLTVTDNNNCTVQKSLPFAVDNTPPPTVTCPGNSTVQNTSTAPFLLTGGSSPDAVETYYSGLGVTTNGTTFNPSIAGNGSHTITYTAASNNTSEYITQCYGTCTFTISVGALPITLKDFRATASENDIHLEWKTSFESHFNHFEVEKSTDPVKGFIKIQEVAGHDSGSSYSYLDQNTDPGTPAYYRLKMIDNDGSYAFSKIVWALSEGSESLSIYPNPASKEFTIKSKIELSGIKLINSSGVLIHSERINDLKTKKIQLPVLPAGIYLLQTETKNNTIGFSKLIVN
ncbi:T9SS type A sorting domain-containing protein [Dyadobacter tibetensis]|uniref:T9SS type A sorting domain-containing protein n=1 Tax=Dyadobacter tibetensis TaxID=1211851 RepID=UPI0004729128|nr:T9SS type A sorting domain-containing protein [Dyadobacter tibetensis]